MIAILLAAANEPPDGVAILVLILMVIIFRQWRKAKAYKTTIAKLEHDLLVEKVLVQKYMQDAVYEEVKRPTTTRRVIIEETRDID